MEPATPIHFRHPVCGDEPYCQIGPDNTTCFEVESDRRARDPYGINRRGLGVQFAEQLLNAIEDRESAGLNVGHATGVRLPKGPIAEDLIGQCLRRGRRGA